MVNMRWLSNRLCERANNGITDQNICCALEAFLGILMVFLILAVSYNPTGCIRAEYFRVLIHSSRCFFRWTFFHQLFARLQLGFCNWDRVTRDWYFAKWDFRLVLVWTEWTAIILNNEGNCFFSHKTSEMVGLHGKLLYFNWDIHSSPTVLGGARNTCTYLYLLQLLMGTAL